jgi:hypothetical protein
MSDFKGRRYEVPHEKGTLVHPLLDRSKRMLDDLTAPVENIWPRRHPLFHTIKRIFVLKARDRAVIIRASRAQWVVATRWRWRSQPFSYRATGPGGLV